MIRTLLSFLALATSVAAATNSIPTMIVQDDGSPTNMHLLWQTEPGTRYTLEASTNLLEDWSSVTGYPAEASGLAMDHQFKPDGVQFFRINGLDEQPPRIVAQYPDDESIAISRSADIVVELDDPSGVDPSSLSLTVGAIGPVGSGSAGFGFVSNTVTFDAGATPLGDWGDTIFATLIAADPEGYTLTNTWSFRLETEPQAASNVFVFGSPSAQNMGQQVHGPTAALAAQYVDPSGPRIMNVPQTTWEISEVTSNSVVIAYSDGAAPTFTNGQLICNLTPTSQDEIFYREVLGTTDDTTNSLLTLSTTDLCLTNFVTQGAISVSADSSILELGTNGQVVAMGYVGGTLTFPAIGMNLSGSELALRHDGFEATVLGVTYSLGDDPKWLELTMSEWSWWFTPRIQAGLELDWGGMKSFQAIAQGDVSIAQVCDGTVVLVGVSAEARLFDIQGPWTVVYLGQLGPIPVFATLGVKMGLTAEAHANTQMEFGITYRQDHSSSFGVDYDRATGMKWVRTFQSTEPDFHAEAALTEELGAKLVLDPRVEFLVYGLAGMKAAVEPSVGIETTIPLAGGSWDGKVEADVDFVLGTAGPAFDLLDYHEELGFNIWHGEWPLTPETLSFSTQPKSQTVAPGDAVSFSCTVDASSTPSFQWYHNGLPVPGQNSRSMFRPYVTTGHAGQYKVRATAGSLTEYSDPATLTVVETTPENQDSDGDGIPDIYETNTDTWVSDVDRGTDPYSWDSDGDGLSDGVETRTGIYVSRNSTGTDPTKSDTDGDGVNDKREIDIDRNPNASGMLWSMAFIPGGTNAGTDPDFGAYSLTVSSFYMDRTEVTNDKVVEVMQWAYDNSKLLVTASSVYNAEGDQRELVNLNDSECRITWNGSRFGIKDAKGSGYPCVEFSWHGAVAFCNYRSLMENGRPPCYDFSDWSCNFSTKGYRLPTASEWEYAARGGVGGQRFPWGTSINHDYANYSANGSAFSYDTSPYTTKTPHPDFYVGSPPFTSPVGSFAPNGYGLFDMAGSVYEWCNDEDPSSYGDAGRAIRGGCYGSLADRCRIGHRASWTYTAISWMGFRTILPNQ